MYKLKVTLSSDNGAHWEIDKVFYLTEQIGATEKTSFVSQKDRERILDGSFLLINKLQYKGLLDIYNWATQKSESIKNTSISDIPKDIYSDLIKINALKSFLEPSREQILNKYEINDQDKVQNNNVNPESI